jgi:hypothetical protein
MIYTLEKQKRHQTSVKEHNIRKMYSNINTLIKSCIDILKYELQNR